MGQFYKYEHFSGSTASDPVRMAERIMQFAPATDAEALKLLRRSYPDSPLSARIAALAFLMRRKSRALPRTVAAPYTL